MKRSFAAFLGLAALLGAGSTHGLDLGEIHQRASRSVVAIKAYDSTGFAAGEGTGFAVPGGLIATNCHVAREGRSLVAVLSKDLETEIIAVVACDERNDLALLRPAASVLEHLPLATRPALVGQRIVVLGNPLGLSGTLSEGIVAAVRQEGVEVQGVAATPRIQISAPISPGSSGSPVMNVDGEVVGVVDSQYRYGQNLNFAVPVERLTALLASTPADSMGRGLEPRELSGRVYWRNVLISAVLFVFVGYLLWRK